MREMVTEYTLIPDGHEHFDAIEVVRRHYEDDSWAVVRRGRTVLNTDGEWEYEPQPSSRDDDFLARCRFTERNALALARDAVKEIEKGDS